MGPVTTFRHFRQTTAPSRPMDPVTTSGQDPARGVQTIDATKEVSIHA
jgi:hypothetical protein